MESKLKATIKTLFSCFDLVGSRQHDLAAKGQQAIYGLSFPLCQNESSWGNHSDENVMVFCL